MFQNTGGYSPIVVAGLPHVKEVDDLKRHLHEAEDRLVCLTIAAGWCEPCRRLLASYEDIIENHSDVCFLLVDVDESGDIQVCFGVTMVPTVVLIRKWLILEVFVGCCPRRLRRRIRLYRPSDGDEDEEDGARHRTDLRRIYELIRDDTYMVTSQLQENMEEANETRATQESDDDDDDDDFDENGLHRHGRGSRAEWKRMSTLSRGPQAIGLTFAPKPTKFKEKNWMIAEAYLKARREKTPTDADQVDGRSGSRPSTLSDDVLSLRSIYDDDSSYIPPLWEDEGWEEDEDEEDRIYSWRDTEWHKAVYDEWKGRPGREEEGRKPESAPTETEREGPSAGGISSAAPQFVHKSRPITAPPRSILKHGGRRKEAEGAQSVAWSRMQDERKQAEKRSLTARMMHYHLEDRDYSRDEVIKLLRRCQRVCTTRYLDDQMRDMATDEAGKELQQSRRQRQIAAARRRMTREMALRDAEEARQNSPHMSITPRRSFALPRRSKTPRDASDSITTPGRSFGKSSFRVSLNSFSGSSAGAAKSSVSPLGPRSFQQKHPTYGKGSVSSLRRSIKIAAEKAAKTTSSAVPEAPEGSNTHRATAISFLEHDSYPSNSPSPSTSRSLQEEEEESIKDLENRDITKGKKGETNEEKKAKMEEKYKKDEEEKKEEKKAVKEKKEKGDKETTDKPTDSVAAEAKARPTATDEDRRTHRGSRLHRTENETKDMKKYKQKQKQEEDSTNPSSGASD